MSNIRIERVSTKKDLNRFIKFAWQVYADDSNWVPPLIMDIKEKLDKEKNPFLKHAEVELFLAYAGDELSGRIAAILERSHNEIHKEKVVFFGLYESFNDEAVCKSLLDTVIDWGRARGMEILRGPINISMNDECAFLLEGFDSPPTVMMPYNPPYYLDLMEKNGLSKAKDLYAYFMNKDHKITKKVEAIVNKIKQVTDITLRTIDMKNLDEETERIKYIYNQGWEQNWGFVPWTEEEMAHQAKKLKNLADPNLIIFAEDKGRPIGFAFGLPNYNEILPKMNGKMTPLNILKFLFLRKKIKGMRAAVFGILREYRMSGVSYLLYDQLEKNAIDAGYEWAETSWQLEDNDAINRFVVSVGGEIYKKYRIFEKNFSDTSGLQG